MDVQRKKFKPSEQFFPTVSARVHKRGKKVTFYTSCAGKSVALAGASRATAEQRTLKRKEAACKASGPKS